MRAYRRERTANDANGWSAVYGAMVAAQVMDRMSRGEGPPDSDEAWDHIVEEAFSVADEAGRAAERYDAQIREERRREEQRAAERYDAQIREERRREEQAREVER